MAFLELMHPRNIYKNRKPNFKELMVKYPDFAAHMKKTNKGVPFLDFKDPASLRALSWVLLKEDFGLDVEMPQDRLIPTIPLRLNYILWLEDILGPSHSPVTGIDIGAGASCVYPLLGAKKNGWKFLASEADATNLNYARQNVSKNNMEDNITVRSASEDSGLYDLVEEEAQSSYDFCMCNPPFFGTSLEAWGGQSRTEARHEPHSVNTASPQESIVPGGEVNFVKRMIDDSLVLKERVRVYTTMLGKKSSLAPLKDHLKNKNIINVGHTEFCQGRTMRWGLGWSFCDDIKFPKPPSKQLKGSRPRPPMTYKLPRQMSLVTTLQYSIPFLGSIVMAQLEELKILYEPETSTMEKLVLEIVARRNTWSNQRRRRRNEKQLPQKKNDKKHATNSFSESCTGEEPAEKRLKKEEENEACLGCDVPPGQSSGARACEPQAGSAVGNGKSSVNPQSTKASRSADTVDGDKSYQQTTQQREGSDHEDLDMTVSIEDVTDFVVRSHLSLVKDADDILLQLTWLEGCKESLHQILQFFKNRLK